jgi:hypothetical protein
MPNIVKKSMEYAGFQPEEGMMELLVIFIMLVVLDLTAMRWGAISLDGFNSPEWERRQRWLAFH